MCVCVCVCKASRVREVLSFKNDIIHPLSYCNSFLMCEFSSEHLAYCFPPHTDAKNRKGFWQYICRSVFCFVATLRLFQTSMLHIFC